MEDLSQLACFASFLACLQVQEMDKVTFQAC